MLGYIEIAILKKNFFLYQGKERPAKKKLVPARSHFFREYFRENEFLRETILTSLLEAQMGSIHLKKMPKNLVTHPLYIRIVPSPQTEMVIFHKCSKMTDKQVGL